MDDFTAAVLSGCATGLGLGVLVRFVAASLRRGRELDDIERESMRSGDIIDVSLDDLGATEVTRQVRRITPPLDLLDDGEAVDPNPLPASWGGPDDVDDLDDDGPEAA